jgi:hypothetical protein
MIRDTFSDWLETFWKVIVSPTPKTFLAEAKKADGKFASAVGWLVFFAVYFYILANIVIAPLGFSELITVAVALPLAFVLLTSAMHFTYQRLAHRKEYLYDKMLYMSVSILLPLQFIFVHAALLLPERLTVALSYALLLYQIALLTVAIKHIANIKYWQALVSVFISIVAGIAVALITLLLIYSTIVPPETTNQ